MTEEERHLLSYGSYLEEARKFAEAKQKGTDYAQSDVFQAFGARTQEIIKTMGESLLSTGKPIDMAQTLFKGDVTTEGVKNFFNDYPGVQSILENNPLFQDNLLKNTVVGDRWQKWLINPTKTMANIFHGAAGDYPYPPVDWVLNTLYGATYFLSKFAENRASKSNPLIQIAQQQGLKKASAAGALMGTVALVGLGLMAGAGGAIAGPVLIAVGATSLALSHLAYVVRSVRMFLREIKKKEEAPETYVLRVFDRGLTAVKAAATAAFYICAAVLAIGAVVALVSNPIGLGVLAGAMATIGMVVMGISVATGILGERTKRKIDTIEQRTGVKTYKRDIGPPTPENAQQHQVEHLLREKSGFLIDHLNENAVKKGRVLGKEHFGSMVAHRKGIHSGYQLARHIAKHKQHIVHLHRDAITPEKFQSFAESAAAMIDAQSAEVPLYKGVKHHVIKDAYDKIESLVVEIPKKAVDIREGHLKHDEIKINQPHSKDLEVTLTRHSSDETIFIFLDMMRSQVPTLEMDYCGDPRIVLKMIEASKLSNFEIHFDPKDLASLANNADPQMSAYYQKIKEMKSDEFHQYFDARENHQLGEYARPEGTKPSYS